MSTPLKVLIVEDSEHKRERIVNFLRERIVDLKLSVAHSFNSACKRIDDFEFDLAIMDMSIPTYDKSTTESGGRFRVFGGHELARKIVRKSIGCRIVFITQFDSFSTKSDAHTLESLDKLLEKDCGKSYAGLIHYDSSKSSWKDELERSLRISK